MFNREQINGFENFLFKIATPCFLFYLTATCSVGDIFNVKYICSYLLSFFFVALLTVILIYKHNTYPQICIKILASSYVNTAIYATPVLAVLFKNPIAAVIGNIIQVVCIQSFFLIIFSFLQNKNKSLFFVIGKIIYNPLIIMPIAGLIFNYYNLTSYIIYLLIITSQIGNLSVNLSLFVFGLMLGNFTFEKNLISKEIFMLVLIKNIAHPFIAYIVGKYVFHLSGYWLNSLIIIKSAPTALIVYFIAKNYSTQGDNIKYIVSLSSVASLLSIIFIYFLL